MRCITILFVINFGIDAVAFQQQALHHKRTTTTTTIHQSNKVLLESNNYETFGDAALSSRTFTQHYPNQLPKWLTIRAEECGWKYPTLVQERALDTILDGKDCILQSQTGSGKTLSYLLPLLACIDKNRSAVQGLVVVPTRELGIQVARVARRLAAASTNDGFDENDLDTALLLQDEDNDDISDQESSEEGTPVRANSRIMIMSVLQGSGNKRQRAWARYGRNNVLNRSN
jgi:superfamily II DNA/RNA helicase